MQSATRWFWVILITLGPAHSTAKVMHADARSADFGYEIPLQTSRQKAWNTLIKPQHWWSDSHTWSGKASNLKLDPKVGGCWCERWDGNSVEHGRIIGWKPGKGFRMQAVFGPMQEQALTGIMDYRIEDREGKTVLIVAYRLAGADNAALDKLAPIVDRVMQEQLDRLKRLADTEDTKR